MQNIGTVRKIDELGRVVLPLELRKIANWDTGDSLAILYDEKTRTTTLKLSEKYGGPKCVLCGKNESKAIINDRDICSTCLEAVKEI